MPSGNSYVFNQTVFRNIQFILKKISTIYGYIRAKHRERWMDSYVFRLVAALKMLD